MREFLDKDTGLKWYAPQKMLTAIDGNMNFDIDDMKTLDEFRDRLNQTQWNTGNVATFITGGKMLLGDLFRSRSNHIHSQAYYAFDGGVCVGAMMMKRNVLKVTYSEFKDYVAMCEERDVDRIDKYMLLADAKRALTQSDLDNYMIDYLVVPQNHQGRGYGNRIVTSLNNNIEFFAGKKDINLVSAQINDQNKPCIKLFNSHGYYSVIGYDYSQYHTSFDLYHKVMEGNHVNENVRG